MRTTRSHHLRGYGFALLAAVLWATLGLFYAWLSDYGLPLITIVFFRASIGALLLLLVLIGRRRDLLRLRRRDWPLFLALGFFAVALYFAYATAISLAGMGVAAVLMYTAPVWVTLLGLLFLGERLTGAKVGALLLAGAGCALVGKVYDLANVRLNLPGILAGLATGLAYAIYIVLCKVCQRRSYSPWTTLVYALGLGALFLIPLQTPATLAGALGTTPVPLVLIALAIIPTLGGGGAFNAALRDLPASEATIVGTLEPAVAALLGWAFLGERLGALQVVGAGLILIAVIVLQARGANQRPKT